MKHIPTINIHAAVEIVASASCSLSLLYLLTTGSIYRLIAPNSYIIALLWALTLLLLWSTIKASKNIFHKILWLFLSKCYPIRIMYITIKSIHLPCPSLCITS